VKKYTYEEYDKIVDSEVTYTKLDVYFDLDMYLNFTHKESTCIDFCLFVIKNEKISLEILNSAYNEYIEVKKDIKNISFNYFISF
jgi:hypothetical protein